MEIAIRKIINIHDIGLKGQVKSIQENAKFIIETNEIVKRESADCDKYFKFNLIGNCTEYNEWRDQFSIENGKYKVVSLVKLFDYDSRNNLIKFYSLNPYNGTKSEIYLYNDENRLVEKKEHGKDFNYNVIRIYKYVYDESGNKMDLYEVNENGDILNESYFEYSNSKKCILHHTKYKHFKHIYDTNDRLVESQRNSTSGGREGWQENKYDIIGNLIETKDFGLDQDEEDGSTIISQQEHKEYQYDLNGNKTEEITYNKRGEKVFVRTYYYDEFGNIKTQINDSDPIGDNPHKLIRYSFRFDKYGNKIAEGEFRNGEVIFVKRWDYSYDEIGNWITKNVYEADIVKYSMNRKIEYY